MQPLEQSRSSEFDLKQPAPEGDPRLCSHGSMSYVLDLAYSDEVIVPFPSLGHHPGTLDI